MALIGYARVSTAEQDTALQTDALRKAGCEGIFEDTISGAKAERPGLASALAYLRDGDVLVLWRLDRLGRSLLGVFEVADARREAKTQEVHQGEHVIGEADQVVLALGQRKQAGTLGGEQYRAARRGQSSVFRYW